MPETNPTDKGISYIYRCRNRKCSQFKKDVPSDKDPIAHLAKHANVPTCHVCADPLVHFRTTYPKTFREVFAEHIPGIQLGEPGDALAEIIRAAAAKVDNAERDKKERKRRP